MFGGNTKDVFEKYGFKIFDWLTDHFISSFLTMYINEKAYSKADEYAQKFYQHFI